MSTRRAMWSHSEQEQQEGVVQTSGPYWKDETKESGRGGQRATYHRSGETGLCDDQILPSRIDCRLDDAV